MSGMEQSQAKVAEAVSIPYSEEAVIKYYKDWAQQYDNDVLQNSQYNGPAYLVEHIQKLSIDKNSKILDLLGGTGILAKLLKKHGYNNIDILDASEAMLEESRKFDLYKEYIRAYIGGESVSPIADGTYNCVILTGGFAPGHATSDIFPEVTRIVKTGGMFVWIMRNYPEDEYPISKFHQDVDKMCASGTWKMVTKVVIEQYVFGITGTLFAVQILQHPPA